MEMNAIQNNEMNRQIIEMIDKTIDILCEDFRDYPSKYFTENDLVCAFYDFLPDVIKKGYEDHRTHLIYRLVHMEYPTPFRCDMGGLEFKLVKDTDRKITDGEEGGKFKRGHFDIVVLNPSVISHFSYEEIKSQNYQVFLENVKNKITTSNPMILYAIEFLLHRDIMKTERAVDNFVKKIYQDHDKLKASKEPIKGLGCPGFVVKYSTIAFFTDSRQLEAIKMKVRDNPDIKLQPSLNIGLVAKSQ